jgi:hypothetical protein
MRSFLSLGLLFLLGCDASGSVSGGELLIVDPCSSPSLGHTWTDLYTCYFGPSGKASCTAQGICHGAAGQTGALTSGYICGTTKDSCWSGMTQGLPGCDAGTAADAAPDAPAADTGSAESGASDGGSAGSGASDGGSAESAAPSMCVQPPIALVPAGSAANPSGTGLWGALRGATGGAGGVGLHNMPYSATATGGVTFTQADLDRIAAWISEGAQDN